MSFGKYSNYGLQTDDAVLGPEESSPLKAWLIWGLILIPAISLLVLLYRMGGKQKPGTTPPPAITVAAAPTREANPLKGISLSTLIRPTTPEATPPPEPPTTMPTELAKEFAVAEQYLKDGNYLEARTLALKLITSTNQTTAFVTRAENLAAEAGVQWLLSGKLTKGKVDYTVEPGDSPDRIARKFGVTTALLMRVNQMTDPRKLRVGQHLIIPDKPAFTWASIDNNSLVLLLENTFFKRYRIIPGSQSNQLWITTPTGREIVAFATTADLAEVRLLIRR